MKMQERPSLKIFANVTRGSQLMPMGLSSATIQVMRKEG